MTRPLGEANGDTARAVQLEQMFDAAVREVGAQPLVHAALAGAVPEAGILIAGGFVPDGGKGQARATRYEPGMLVVDEGQLSSHGGADSIMTTLKPHAPFAVVGCILGEQSSAAADQKGLVELPLTDNVGMVMSAGPGPRFRGHETRTLFDGHRYGKARRDIAIVAPDTASAHAVLAAYGKAMGLEGTALALWVMATGQKLEDLSRPTPEAVTKEERAARIASFLGGVALRGSQNHPRQ